MNYTRAALPLRQSSTSMFRANARQIMAKVPHFLYRAVRASLRSVDLDIERHGAVTYETVEQVRATRALLGMS